MLPLSVGCCFIAILLAIGAIAFIWLWRRKRGKGATVEEQKRKWNDENIEGMKDADFEEL